MIYDSKTVAALQLILVNYAEANGIQYAPNTAYDPSISETYITDKFMTNDDNSVGMAASSSDYTKPIHQINIYMPLNSYRLSIQQQAEEIKALFPKYDFILDDGQQKTQIDTVSTSQILTLKSHFWIAVSVNLTTIATNI